jgi:hypothetical protein
VLLRSGNEIDVPVVDRVTTPATVTLHTVPLAKPLSVNTAVKVPLTTVNVTVTDANPLDTVPVLVEGVYPLTEPTV